MVGQNEQAVFFLMDQLENQKLIPGIRKRVRHELTEMAKLADALDTCCCKCLCKHRCGCGDCDSSCGSSYCECNCHRKRKEEML